MINKTSRMKPGWKGRIKKGGGSSPSEEKHYEFQYEKREKKVRDKLDILLKKLKKKYPNRNYEIVSHNKTTNRNKTTVYQIIRKDEKIVS